MRGAAKKSLMNLPSFRTMYAGKQSNVAATVYVRMKGVDMGKPTDGIRFADAAWAVGRSLT